MFLSRLPFWWLITGVHFEDVTVQSTSLCCRHVKKTESDKRRLEKKGERRSTRTCWQLNNFDITLLFFCGSLYVAGISYSFFKKGKTNVKSRQERGPAEVWPAVSGRCLPAHWHWQYRFWLTVTGSLCNQMSTVCSSSRMCRAVRESCVWMCARSERS